MKKKIMWQRKRQAEFFENLSYLLSVGYDLENALKMVQVLLKIPKQQIHLILVELRAGATFSQVMTPYVRQELIQQLDFAAVHGRLVELLQALGHRERDRLLQYRKLRQVLLYPAVLLILLGFMLAAFVIFLLPELQQLGVNLQLLDIKKPYYWVIGWTVSIVSGIFYYKKQSWYKRLKLLMKVPLVGKVIKLSVEYYICLQLGLLLTSSVELSTIVKRAQQARQYQLTAYIGDKAWRALSDGRTIDQFILELELLPKECSLLFTRGQPQYQVGEEFQILAQRKFRLLDELIQKYMTFIQPICFAIIGVVVIGMYYLTLVPMYQSMGGIIQ